MSVPLLDLAPHHAPIAGELEEAMLRVLRSGRFILGPEVEAFETEMAAFLGCDSVVGCSSGTDALLAILMALDVGPGDEVITSPFTFFATAGVVVRLGARPVFVDIEPDTMNLDPEGVAAAITERTRVVMPVHLFGQPVDMDRLVAVSGELPLVEDACQAIGASWRGRAVGRLGAAAGFSFFPSKNLGCAGDGGAVTTDDPELAARVRRLRAHGQSGTYMHDEVGGNFRMDALQAALLRVKLPHLKAWNRGRRANAERYRQLFQQAGLLGDPVAVPVAREQAEHVYHQYVIRVPRRDELAQELARRQIGHAVYYPLPLHLQDCFRNLDQRDGSCPQAERAAREVIALPIYPELEPDLQDEVVEAIHDFYRGG